MELKSLEDWTLEKQFKSVPDVVDVSSFGGMTREYQVRVDPDKLVSYGLSIGQVEQQLANNNVNAGGSFIEAGPAADQRARGRPVTQRRRHREDGAQDAERARRCASRTLPRWCRGRRFGWGRSARPSTARTARSSTTTTSSRASCCCRRAPTPTRRCEGIHEKVEELNDHILPPGVKIVPFLDRSDLLHYTTHTVLHNLTEGIILVVIILFLFLGNVRGALIVALTIPFALLFASICLDLRHIPANLLSLGALDFGMVVDGAVVMVENIVRHLSQRNDRQMPTPRSRSARPRTRCSGRSSTRSASSSPRICRSSRCRRSKDGCSSRWPGRWPSRCWAR